MTGGRGANSWVAFLVQELPDAETHTVSTPSQSLIFTGTTIPRRAGKETTVGAMSWLLIVALLGGAPSVDAGTPKSTPAAFERLKALEGNWRAKDGHVVTYRVLSRTAVVEQVQRAGVLESICVFRLEADTLVATLDGAAHQVLNLTSQASNTLTFGTVLSLTLRENDTLGRREGGVPLDLLREYVDTLK